MDSVYRAKERPGAMVGTVAGGFVFIQATAMLAAWQAYRRGDCRFRDLRCWWGIQEMLARRCELERGRLPKYSLEELATLTGLTKGSVRSSVNRLDSCGLIDSGGLARRGSTTRLSVTRIKSDLINAPTVANLRRLVPVPRRTVRMLSQVGKPAVMATVAGHLLRDVYYRGGSVVSWGRCKSSWIAETFDVSLRAVKNAMAHLLGIAWLNKAPSTSWATKRHGGAYVVNLEWSRPESYADVPQSRTNGSAPEKPETSNGSAPRLNENLPTEPNTKTSNPIRATGVLNSERQKKEPPTWRHIERHDLTDSSRLMGLFESARRAGAVNGSEHERFFFFAAAEHALVHGDDPCALFVNTIKLKRWKCISQDDEDAARQRLNRVLFGTSDQARRAVMSAPRPPKPKPVELTRDQKLAQAIATVSTQKRLPPMLVIRSMKLDWTKERFDELCEQAEYCRLRRFRPETAEGSSTCLMS